MVDRLADVETDLSEDLLQLGHVIEQFTIWPSANLLDSRFWGLLDFEISL